MLPGRRSASSRSCRSRTGSSARRSPRSAAAARPMPRSRSSSTRIAGPGQGRDSRSITCAPGARKRRSRRCAGALRENPDNVDAMRYARAALLARGQAASRRCGGAAAPATQLAPGHVAAWMLLGSLAPRARTVTPKRSSAISRAPTRAARTRRAWSGLGTRLRACSATSSKAREAYARSLPLHPRPARTSSMSYGHVLKTLGDQARPLRAYRAAIAAKPDFGEVYWSMANLKVFRFEDDEVAAMEEQLERAGPDREAPTSISGSRSARPTRTRATTTAPGTTTTPATSASGQLVSHDPVGVELRHEQIAEVFTPRVPRDARRRRATSRAAPIFIVGLPRSGSTLIEQILASHSQVEGTRGAADARCASRSRSAAIAPTSKAVPGVRAATCAGRTSAPTASSTSRKRAALPLDRQAALHRQAAEQFLARRSDPPDPAEREGHQCAPASLRQLPRRLQAAVRQGPALHLRHGGARRLLPPVPRDDAALAPRAAGQGARRPLRGDGRRISRRRCAGSSRTAACRSRKPACASTRTQRAVRTASSEQVRQPIYTRALGYWRRFEKHLGSGRRCSRTSSSELPDSGRDAGDDGPVLSRKARPPGRGWRCARPSSG